MSTPEITPQTADSHVLGLLLALADRLDAWHPFSAFDLDGEPDRDWRRYVGSAARFAASRGLVTVRRASAGRQVRITDAGRARVVAWHSQVALA